MIYTKDGLTKEKFIELLQYSLRPECQFLTAMKPNTQIINDHVFQPESAVRLLKVEEKNDEVRLSDGTKAFSYRFSVKVLVEDKYWIEVGSEHYKSEKVPAQIHNNVAQILNG